MTLPSPHLRLALAALLAFACALGFALLRTGGDLPVPAAPNSPLALVPRAAASTDADVRRLQAELRAAPDDPRRQVALAGGYLQEARETGDPGFYSRAERLLRAAGPRAPGAAVGLGTLALARHDFAGALTLARRAGDGLAVQPVLVDALVELGRYGAAERALQRMVDLKPNLAAYARVSYLRELHGDLDGAVEAMRLAVSAGAAAPEAVASVQVLLGNLELARGRPGAAARAYGAARAAAPGHVPALAGQARLAATRGDLAAAVAAWRTIVGRLPLPEYAIALGEAELAAGRGAEARRDLALVPAQARLMAAAGVNADVELAIFEADHGSPARAVRLARGAWAAAPSVRSADAVGWALSRAGRAEEGLAWARRALRLGSRDPLFLAHAGLTAAAAGRPALARRRLRSALEHGLAAHPWQAQRVHRTLGRLS